MTCDTKGRLSVLIETNDADGKVEIFDDIFNMYEEGSFIVLKEGTSIDKTFYIPKTRIKNITSFLKGVK